MAGRDFDPRIIFGGLMERVLCPVQAAALFRENMVGARYFLTDRLGEALRDPRYKDTTDLDCHAGRLLEVYWCLFGPTDAVHMYTLHELPIVERFLTTKLRDALDECSDSDLDTFARRFWGTPMHQLVLNAQARKLVPVAELLLRNPTDLNRDVVEVKNRVSSYQFTAELNEVLDKVEAGLAAGGDQYDQAAMLKHMRTFYEKLHEQAAIKLRTERVPVGVDATDLTKCQQVIDYLARHNVLTDKMRVLGRALYGVLSEEGVHSLKADPEYVRLCRNMVAEYAIVLFFELDRRLLV